MKSKRDILLYILEVVLIVGGLLALWLPNRNTEDTETEEVITERPDTDPNAPFVDLPEWEKELVKKGASEYWTWALDLKSPLPVWWFGEVKEGQTTPLDWENYLHGVQYYGTFGGYYIILSPLKTWSSFKMGKRIGEYEFWYDCSFQLLAYKEGVATPLEEIYEKGKLTDEQIGLIYQFYERYRQEIYTRKAWEENGKN